MRIVARTVVQVWFGRIAVAHQVKGTSGEAFGKTPTTVLQESPVEPQTVQHDHDLTRVRPPGHTRQNAVSRAHIAPRCHTRASLFATGLKRFQSAKHDGAMKGHMIHHRRPGPNPVLVRTSPNHH